MLSAIDEKGKLIHLVDELPKKQAFSCPVCCSKMILKQGSVMRPHFAHLRLEDCHFFSENESAEHLSLKACLYQSLSKTEDVEIEKILSSFGQVADLMVNHSLALEVQCSRLSEQRLKERTKAYHDNGFQVLWLLGKNLWLKQRLTSLQKQFLYFSQNMGFHCWELDLDKQVLRLKYLIYEDLHGRIHYLTKEVSFKQDLMPFFRLPYQKQSLSSYEVFQDKCLLTYIQKQLFLRNPYWLKKQEVAYSNGENLLSKNVLDFFPQVRPPESQSGFCQIRQDLSDFRTAFFHYYEQEKDKQRQILYPPAFYDKIIEN